MFIVWIQSVLWAAADLFWLTGDDRREQGLGLVGLWTSWSVEHKVGDGVSEVTWPDLGQ